MSETSKMEAGAAGKANPARPDSADSLRDEAHGLARDLRDGATSLAEEQKQDATDRVDGIAETLHETSDSFRDRGERTAASLADSAADEVERFAQSLREKDVLAMIDDASDLARRHPAAFLGGAVTLGFLASRFVRSTSGPEGDSDESDNPPSTGRA